MVRRFDGQRPEFAYRVRGKRDDGLPTSSNSSIGFNIAPHLGARYDEEVKQWVTWCPALKLYAQGDTVEQAIENIHETVSLFPGTCYELGTLNRVLHECGFRRGCGVQNDPYTHSLVGI